MNSFPNFINVELSSLCNKSCYMCGRRKIDKEYPEYKMNYGFMDFELVKKIAPQIPKLTVIAFHWNGEALLYPRFGEAIDLFNNISKVLDTNGKLIVKKINEIIDRLDTITISVIENDPESDEQYENVVNFLELKGTKKPLVIFRLLGDVARLDVEYKLQRFEHKEKRWYELADKHNCIIAKRILHDPMGSFKYKKPVIIPEVGFCVEALSHIAIDRFGDVYPCVRLNPEKKNLLGNINEVSLSEICNSEKRINLIEKHIKGKRKEIDFCNKCDYWGCPKG